MALLRNCDAIAAVETAIAMPLLIVLCLGGFELARQTVLNLKLERAAYTLADITAQNESLTNAQIDDIFESIEEIIDPFSFGTAGIAYVSSAYLAEGEIYPEVLWQRDGGGTASYTSQVGSAGLTATLPNGLTLNERDNIIISEIYYDYTPMFSLGLFGARTFYKVTVFKPRLGDLTTSPT